MSRIEASSSTIRMRLCTLGPLVGYDGHIAAMLCYTAMTIVTIVYWLRPSGLSSVVTRRLRNSSKSGVRSLIRAWIRERW